MNYPVLRYRAVARGRRASTIEVDNITKLINALNRATAGVTIRPERGEYKVDAPLSSQRRFKRRPAESPWFAQCPVRSTLTLVHSRARRRRRGPVE